MYRTVLDDISKYEKKKDVKQMEKQVFKAERFKRKERIRDEEDIIRIYVMLDVFFKKKKFRQKDLYIYQMREAVTQYRQTRTERKYTREK